ncbi:MULTISPECIES: signal recognition particle-docking protein FtsY [unclassified Symbiopectobacterium]|uniref:signal recognition particle-docking protein FtsY n=1 Tax=unclassified Symbiopectobacterium TaxID=2794573 RepID=UPI0022263C59|nr:MULTISPECIES: signal recognition particle-docking protein FtsY [unclassified Symbiopectobacterium]MCW2476411.1 signal recognition particle-docking protein FtsY [Candidatus Symbiopectobacterium sp. NZEC151]MCW2487783.1 signal recognition particle-docking protein FtsY [Candidatus Symbiopectobacterium sp. NZEC127]
MTKEKKRGFFSWLGLGRQEEERTEQPQAAEQQQDVAQPQDSDVPVVSEVHTETPNDEPDVQPEVHAAQAHEQAVAQQPESPRIADIVETAETTQGAESSVRAEVPEIPESQHSLPPQDVLQPQDRGNEQEIDEQEITQAAENVAEPVPVAQEQERPTKEGFFARLKRSLVKTRENLGSGFIGLFRGKKIDDDLFEELEEQLLIADVGVETTRKIITDLTEHASRKQLKDADALLVKLKEEMGAILNKVDEPLNVDGHTPYVILMVGVNGVGKTTTIGKLARQFQAQGKSVMLAAGDTFRAAAVEQLQVWGQRNNVAVVAQHTGADSASVIFDAIQAAKARGADVLIADTAGRLQNKAHLMEELKKIVRVMKKLDESAPHEIMLTLDASTGQNAVSQAKLFNDAVGLTGITLTKLDGTAKGGVIFAIADQFGIPIRYIGVGEGIDDLRPFKADDFIEALFARED